MKLLDKAKAISGDLRESAIGLKEAGLDKVRDATDAFNAARPHLAKAGYRLVNGFPLLSENRESSLGGLNKSFSIQTDPSPLH